MGNQASFEPHSDFKDIKTHYEQVKKFNDPRFGEIKLLKEKSTGQTIFQKDFTSSTAKDFEEYVKEIKSSAGLAHPNLVKIHGYNSNKEDLFCADFYKLSIFFETFDGDLEQEINRRKVNKEYFPESELWYILDSTASAAAYLQNNNIPHGDIRPHNVIVTPSRDYKLAVNKVFRQTYNPGELGLFDNSDAQSRYYSPELLNYHATPEGKRVLYDRYKNDVFGLGMTMLEAGTLEKTPAAYNFDDLNVRQPPIKESVNQLRGRYSDNFVRTVESALDFNPETRLDFARLDRELSAYRREIRENAQRVPGGETTSGVVTSAATHHATARPAAEKALKSGAPQVPENVRPLTNNHDQDDLDFRVREAVRRSEDVIRRTSPKKFVNKNLDPYIESYLRNDLQPQNQPLLYTISPYLTSESKYTTTLTIEQPNYGRESQPLNFGASHPRDDVGESIKRSAYVDVSAQGQAGGYGQSQGTQNVQTTPFSYGQAEPNYAQGGAAYNQAANYSQGAGAYGQQTGGYAQQGDAYGQQASQYLQSGTTFGQQNYTQQSSGLNYGVNSSNYGQGGAGTNYGGNQNYGTGVGAGVYGANSYESPQLAGVQQSYVSEADDLSRKIEERLRQSRTVNQQAY